MALSLRGRIVLTLAPVLAFLFVIGIAGVLLLSHLGGRTNAILRENYDSVIAMERLREATERIDSSYQFTLSGEETKARAQYQANWVAYREALRIEQGNITLPGEKELVEELTALTEQYQQQGDAFYARASNDPGRRQDYFGSPGLLETFTRIKSVSDRIAQINQEHMEQASRNAKRTAWWSLFGFAIGFALTLILSGLAAWYMFSTILRPVRAVTQSARGVSAGNLDQVVPYLSSDALGELAGAFNQMTQRLREDQKSTEQRTQELITTTETLRRELSEREKLEQSLRQLASIVESSDDAIFSRGPDGTIASWNKGAERLFGYPAETVLGQSHFMLVPAEYQSELSAILERVHRGEHVEHFETVRRRKDGERIWVSLTCFPVHDEAGAIISVASIVRDITEKKRAEEQLRRASAYNRSLIEASLDPLVTIGPDGKITDVNAVTEAATGRPRAELVGTDFADYFTEPDRAREGYQRVFSEGAVRDYPLEIRHRDGHLTSVLYNAAIYRDEHGEVVGVFAAARDITARKRAEERVKRLAILQGVVAELGLRALRTDSTTGLLDETVAAVARNVNVDFCNVLEVLPGGEELLLRAAVGWKEGMVGRARVKAQGTQPGYVIHSECPVIVTDAETETRFALLPQLFGESVTSAMSVVIATPEGPYGALGAHSRHQRTFTQDEVHFLQAVANVLGAAIQRQRSEERLRRLNRAHRALSSCNQSLIRTTQESDWIAQVCRIVVEEAEYRLCWVGYSEQDEAKTVRPVAQAGFEEGYLKTVNITWADTERGRGPTGTCIRTGQTVVSKNLATDPAFAPWRAEAVKRSYASSVGIPLIADSTTLGALTIYAAEPDAFGDEEVKLLTELAGDLAFGVMTLRTRTERVASAALAAAHQREVEIGFKIQQMLLLDQPPVDVPGLRIAARTIPSRKVDGDFYSFYQHERQHLDVVVADVMGKGIPAALLGAATRSQLLEALCHLLVNSPQGKLPEPREIVTLANAEMVQHLLDLNSFVTLCYLRFDQDRRTLDLVDCGHTGLIHRRAATGLCEIVHGDNLPLGFRIGEIYKQLSVPFETGDLFLLFSDGVTETRNRQGDFFGEGRLLECVRTNGGLEPDALVETIRGTAFAFSGSEAPTDDWTCVVIKVVEHAVPLTRAELDICSDLAELHRVREFVRAACHDLPTPALDDASIGQLELAVTEACSNIIKHAYRGQPDQPINLEVETYPGKVLVTLHHLGTMFDPTKVPPPAFDGSRESGFGVYIINQSVDTVRYYRDDRGRNCVALVKSRKS